MLKPAAELLSNIAPDMAFKPAHEEVMVPVQSRKKRPDYITLRRSNRLVLVGPGVYQIICGEQHIGQVIALTWEQSQQSLKPIPVFKPEPCTEGRDLNNDVVRLDPRDRLILLPECLYLVVHGPNRGKQLIEVNGKLEKTV